MNEYIKFFTEKGVELISNIVWPLVTLLIVIFIKKELFKLLQRISKVKFQDFEADLTIVNENLQELDQTKQKNTKDYLQIFLECHEIAQEEPRKAIIRSWSIFEKLLAEKYPEYNRGNAIIHMQIHSLMNNLQEKKIISKNISDAVLELFRIRNRTLHLHNENEITNEDAKLFLKSIEKLYKYFDLLKQL